MDNKRYIQSYCSIKNNVVSLDGEVLLEDNVSPFSDFIKTAYKALGTKYPKFFKMDSLSKLAFLAADVLLKKASEKDSLEENTAVVFSNRTSSLDTDRKHQESIRDSNNFYPSPAVFVYTLPNICIGEISIKHRLYSENSFFIFDAFNADYLFHYTNGLLNSGKAEKVLCGWVELDGEDYEAFLYLVSEEGIIEHSINEITRLY